MTRKFIAPLFIIMATCIVSLLAVVAYKDEQLLAVRRKLDANSAVISKELKLNQVLAKQIETLTSDRNAARQELTLARNDLSNAHAQIDQINSKLNAINTEAIIEKRKLESCLTKMPSKKGPMKKAMEK